MGPLQSPEQSPGPVAPFAHLPVAYQRMGPDPVRWNRRLAPLHQRRPTCSVAPIGAVDQRRRPERHCRPATRGNRMNPDDPVPAQSADGLRILFWRTRPAGTNLHDDEPSMETASGPIRTSCSFRRCLKTRPRTGSPTGDSSGCGRHAEAPTGTRSPPPCSATCGIASGPRRFDTRMFPRRTGGTAQRVRTGPRSAPSVNDTIIRTTRVNAPGPAAPDLSARREQGVRPATGCGGRRRRVPIPEAGCVRRRP